LLQLALIQRLFTCIQSSLAAQQLNLIPQQICFVNALHTLAELQLQLRFTLSDPLLQLLHLLSLPLDLAQLLFYFGLALLRPSTNSFQLTLKALNFAMARVHLGFAFVHSLQARFAIFPILLSRCVFPAGASRTLRRL
jgi:hypothetical protein